MPDCAEIVSATISVSHMMPSEKRKPTKIDGSAPGRITRRNRSRGHAVAARHLDQLRIDRADAVQRVEVDREEHAERDQEQLGRLVDAEPQDHQRDQRQMRDVADHLQGGVGERVAELRQAVGEAEREAEAAADGEAGEGAQEADPDVARNSPDCISRQPACDTARLGQDAAGSQPDARRSASRQESAAARSRTRPSAGGIAAAARGRLSIRLMSSPPSPAAGARWR